MSINIDFEIAKLQRMTIKELRHRYAEVFGDETNSGNKVWLVRRIAWRLQALAEGGLSQRARQRANELANVADLRWSTPKTPTPPPTPDTAKTVAFQHDDRLPPPGSLLTRKYKGQMVQVKILADGFEYEGRTFTSLSAVAKAITGSHCNGFHFFRLNKGDQA